MSNKLSNRAAELLEEGAQITGSYTKAYYYIENKLFMTESGTIYGFCKWLDANKSKLSADIPFITPNFQNLFENYFLKEL